MSLERLRELHARLADIRVFTTRQQRRRFLLHLLVALVILLGLSILAQRYLTFLTDAAALRATVAQYGIAAPLMYVGIQIVQVVVAPIPGHIIIVSAGYLFGSFWGTVYSMVGITIGTTIAFWLARRYGRSYVERIVHDETLARFDSIDDDYARSALFVFFLLPGLPDDMLCFAGGLTTLPVWQLVVIATIGRMPSIVLTTVVGDLAGTNHLGLALILMGALSIIGVTGYLNRDRLFGLFARSE